MYPYQQQSIGMPVQPARFPTNQPGSASQPVYQKFPTPPLMNSQNFSQQGVNIQQSGMGPYSTIPNQINSNGQRTPNSQTQTQNKGGSFVQVAQPSLQQSQSLNSRGVPLMQPPSLNINNDQSMRTNQFFQQRAPMTQSNNNNQNSQLDIYNQQEQEQIWTNQAQIASMFWEQRCMTMLQRFQWFYQRFQILRNQYSQLSEQMQKMDSQEEWHRFQQHHDQFHEKIEEMEQQLAAVLSENEQLLQQQQAQQNQNVWQQRYQQLLGNFKSLQDEMARMQGSGGKTAQISSEQYQQLQEHCTELQYQYGQVLNELQKYREMSVPDTSKYEQEIAEYAEKLESYKSKLDGLNNQNNQLQNMYSQVELENQRLKQQRKKSAGVDKNKYEQLLRQIEQKQTQIQKLQDDFKARNNLLNNYNRIQAEMSQTSRDLQQKNRQIQQISKQLQLKSRQLEHKNSEAELFRKQAEQKRRQNDQKNRDVEQKAKETDQKTKEIQQKAREVEQRNRQIQQKTREIQQRNRDIDELKKLLNQKDIKMALQLNQNRSKLLAVEETARAKLRQSLETQKRAKQKKIGELQRQVQQLRSQFSKLSEQSFKVQNVQKKLSYLNQQNSNLNETLKKKNQELIELRSVTYELQKLKNVQSEYRKAAEERQKAVDLLKKKNQDIQTLKQENDKLISKAQELSNKRIEINAKSLLTEIDDLNEQISKKQAQIYKLKHLAQLKEDYSSKIEEELRQAKSKIITLEQSFEIEREFNREKDISSSYKNNDYQKRIKNLDYQFSVQLKDTLQKEVAALRKQNIEKQQTIRRQEQNQVQLISKLAIFQKQKDNFDQDLVFRRNKQRQMLLVNEQQIKKYQQLQRSLKVKESDLLGAKQKQKQLNSYISNLKLQIQQHNTLIKSKNKTIEELQNNINTRWSKGDNLDKLTTENNKLKAALNLASQQIETFKFNDQRLSRSKALSVNNMNTSRKEFDKQENTVVTHLHAQNQLLKQEIAKLVEKITDGSFFPQREVRIQAEVQVSPKRDSRKVGQTPVTLNKRLNEFHSKLQNAISANEIDLVASQSRRVVSLWQKQRQQLINNYESQIQQLKDQLQLFKNNYSRSRQQSPIQSARKNVYQDLQAQRLKEELFAYKQKSQEFQQRNITLVKVNEELKSKIQSILKIKQTTSTLDYYKNTCEKIQNQNDHLKQKVKSLTNQNKQYRIELAVKNSKLTQEYQFKIMELQLVIQENQRKIAYLQSEKVSANNEKANLVHDLKINNLDKPIDKNKPASNKSQTSIHNSRNSDYLTKKNQNYGLDSYTPQYPTYSGVEQDYANVLQQIRGTSYIPPRNYDRAYTKEKSSRSYLDSFGYSRSKAGRV